MQCIPMCFDMYIISCNAHVILSKVYVIHFDVCLYQGCHKQARRGGKHKHHYCLSHSNLMINAKAACVKESVCVPP